MTLSLAIATLFDVSAVFLFDALRDLVGELDWRRRIERRLGKLRPASEATQAALLAHWQPQGPQPPHPSRRIG